MKAVDWIVSGVVAIVLVVGAFVVFGGPAHDSPNPAPAVDISVDVDCPDGKCPIRRPWGPREDAGPTSTSKSVVNGRAYDGETLTCDFPLSYWFPNIGSKVDGAGMCVSTSIEMIARYLGLEYMWGYRDWCAKEPGGAYPEKVDDQLKRYCKLKGVPVPPYVNFTGKDPRSLLLQLDAAGLPFAHQYDECPRYASAGNPRGKIAHMVWGAKWGGKYAVVVDNNEIGGVDGRSGKIFEWMPCEEMIHRMQGHGSSWVFAFLAPPPPPSPRIGG